MGEAEKGKKLVDISVVDNSIHMALWNGEEKVCYTILPVRGDDEKQYKGMTNDGKLINCYEEDFIDDFIPKLWSIHDDGMKTVEEITISPLADGKEGKGIYMAVSNGKATINLSMGDKDSVFEIFNSQDELQTFINGLEDAANDIKKGKD